MEEKTRNGFVGFGVSESILIWKAVDRIRIVNLEAKEKIHGSGGDHDFLMVQLRKLLFFNLKKFGKD